jgi:uncharacterized damage-inducible protein DinB
MTGNFLVKLFEHNNWANLRIVEACSTLSDEQLDAEPQTVTKGSIRRTLCHLAGSQNSYLLTLTVPVEERLTPPSVPFAELQASVTLSGEGLLALARGERKPFQPRLQTRDGFYVEPWVLMVQVINHASEHREQVCSMLSALGVTPPDLDGWAYGEAAGAMLPIPQKP